jgi:hypothetical protein
MHSNVTARPDARIEITGVDIDGAIGRDSEVVTGRSIAIFVRFLQRGHQIFQNGSQPLQKAFADGRRGDMPRCPIEQAQAQTLFHGPNRLPECRDRNSKVGSRSCKTAILGNHHELEYYELHFSYLDVH